MNLERSLLRVPLVGLLMLLSPWAVSGLRGQEALLWRPCTLPELVAASDLVVQGRIARIEPGAPGPESVDTAVLEVQRTLLGVLPAEVRLEFPGRARGGDPRDPALIRYDLDQEGIFFLRRGAAGDYTASHPARFKPSFFLTQVQNQLAAGTGG